jgi:hypothetical protein
MYSSYADMERNGLSGDSLYEPDPLKDAYCPSQARYVALGLDMGFALLNQQRRGGIISQKFVLSLSKYQPVVLSTGDNDIATSNSGRASFYMLIREN